MTKFIQRFIFFVIFSCILGEFIVRILKLSSDIPERYVDAQGIQRYKQGQTGYYAKLDTEWRVNKYGWLGVSGTSKDTIISIIGDSFIENMMNPISCNQGTILGSSFTNFDFFEAGRSGVTFIETMEITKILEKEIQPTLHLIYVNNGDFDESVANKERFIDRVQIDLKNNEILKSELKSPIIKKLLYSTKLFYYLYLRFPFFVNEQNKGKLSKNIQVDAIDYQYYEKLFLYCSQNYDTRRMILVFHPGIKDDFVKLAEKNNFRTIVLNSDGDADWRIAKEDEHWSCYGHKQVASQVKKKLPIYLSQVVNLQK